MRISYSALEAFKICPAKYKYSYVDRIRTPQSKEQIFGTLMHEALKILHTPQPMPPTEKEVLRYLMAHWDNAIFASEQESQAWLFQGIGMLKDYYAKNYPANFNVVNLETMFVAPLVGVTETHLISGRIDRIDKLADGSFEIIDYKTSRKMPSQQEVDTNSQLAIYNLGIVNQWPGLFQREKRPVHLSLYYLKHGEKLTSQRSPEQLEQTKQNLLVDINTIQKEMRQPDGFAPRLNPLCNWCEFQTRCSLWRHKFQTEKAPDENVLQTALAEYLQIKAGEQQNKKRLASLQTTINQYCDANNLERVFNDQGYVMRSLQKRTAYNAELLRDILQPLGLWSEVLSFDQKKLAKILANLSFEVRQQIDSASRVKEFKVIKAGFTKKA